MKVLLALAPALAGGLVGAWAGKLLERYRLAQALTLELGKERVAAFVRSARSLGKLEGRIAQVVGGPVGDMEIEDTSDHGLAFLRERYKEALDQIIQGSNESGSQIIEDLVLLGDLHGKALLYYHWTMLRLNRALASPSAPTSELASLIQEVLKARRELSALFPLLTQVTRPSLATVLGRLRRRT